MEAGRTADCVSVEIGAICLMARVRSAAYQAPAQPVDHSLTLGICTTATTQTRKRSVRLTCRKQGWSLGSLACGLLRSHQDAQPRPPWLTAGGARCQ